MKVTIQLPHCIEFVKSINIVSVFNSQKSLPKTFREAFRGIRSALENRLDTRHGLLDYLFQSGVLQPAHVEDICQVLLVKY